MKALLCTHHGSPADLVLDEIEEPEVGPADVRIRVRACGVNFPDVLMIAGKYQVKPPLPFAPGAEVAGDVLETGPEVRDLRAGQRVLALVGHGGMAEQVVAPADAVVPVPETMPYETAAAFMLTYGTAYHALKQRARLAPGETLAVLGAAGGVGLAAVELGRVLGARVIAAASSGEKLALATRHGADAAVNYAEEPLKDRLLELTGGKGADVIFDPVGGELFDACLRAVAWGGRILVIGFAGGTIPHIPANLPLLKGISIVGVFWGRFTQEQPEEHRSNTAELLDLYARGRIQPHISETFALADGGDALARLAGRRALGKIVVLID